jgi:hypothetical protein
MNDTTGLLFAVLWLSGWTAALMLVDWVAH